MRLAHRAHLMCLPYVLLLGLGGCGPQKPDTPAKDATTAADDHSGHDHAGHDHDHHAHGPHGGPILEVGEEEYHVEWTHADDGTVDLFVLDAEMKAEVPIAASQLKLTTQLKGKDPVEYQLAAVAPTGDPPLSAHFALQDPGLLTGLEIVGEDATATLELPIGEKVYQVVFTRHEHAH